MTDHRVVAPEDGWWWYRLPASTPDGYDRRWRIARVLRGAVQPHGSTAWYRLTASRFRDAEWRPAAPPVGDDPPATAITQVQRTTRGERAVATPNEDKVRRVAAEIVDVFVGMSDAMAVYYARHPDDRHDLVAAVTRIMLKAVR